jgi:hypothetical protein
MPYPGLKYRREEEEVSYEADSPSHWGCRVHWQPYLQGFSRCRIPVERRMTGRQFKRHLILKKSQTPLPALERLRMAA